ncbi:MAG: hypothetical protein EZS28_004997, partial [Streblomastix strix]
MVQSELKKVAKGELKKREIYSAPETLLHKRISKDTDIFCIGSILYELLSGYHPFEQLNDEDEDEYNQDSEQIVNEWKQSQLDKENEQQQNGNNQQDKKKKEKKSREEKIIENIESGKYTPFPYYTTFDLKNILSWMMQFNPVKRPLVKQILDHRIIKLYQPMQQPQLQYEEEFSKEINEFILNQRKENINQYEEELKKELEQLEQLHQKDIEIENEKQKIRQEQKQRKELIIREVNAEGNKDIIDY